MRARGLKVEALPLAAASGQGTFVPPTLIEIDSIADLKREVFGPVLHVLRYQRAQLDALVDAINGTGYALTFGLHTRIDETIAQVTQRIAAGNLYVNRNIIGAVVGVQPFGGHGLSGTGPKAGGPLYLKRLVSGTEPVAATAAPTSAASLAPAAAPPAASDPSALAAAYCDFLAKHGHAKAAQRVRGYLQRSALGLSQELPGPVGERNLYLLRPRGRVLSLAHSSFGGLVQLGAILATGNEAVMESANPATPYLADLPAGIGARIRTVAHWRAAGALAALLYEGDAAGLQQVNREAARLEGPIVVVQGASSAGLADGSEDYSLELLLSEVSISTNTAAAGGNAKLMTIG
jgi:RHH-type proline utilization regulon transcriptional repressor/proline dehydrogenase/delta 1-pyrroline-5-carboxylate dehydrogenase